MTKPNELTATIEFARKLQGHVGPYLVIGLKMGAAAKKALNISDRINASEDGSFSAIVSPIFLLARRHTSFHNMHRRQPKTQHQKRKIN